MAGTKREGGKGGKLGNLKESERCEQGRQRKGKVAPVACDATVFHHF